MNKINILVGLLIVLTLSQASSASDSVIVLPQSVAAGAQDVPIPIRITNQDTILGLSIPLVVRNVEGAASISSVMLGTSERFTSALTDIHVEVYYTTDDYPCDGGGTGFGDPVPDTSGTGYPVEELPQALMFSAFNTTGAPLYPGSDTIGSLVITVDVADSAGVFEIDTTCTAPGHELLFATRGGNPVNPVFSSGEITVLSCNCDRHGDVNNDTYITVLDITALAAYLNNGMPIPPDDDSCPHVNRADVNCDGEVDEDDYNYLVAYVFQSGPAPCDPCDCDPYPSSCQ